MANRAWLGAAAAVAQVDRVVFALTWAAGDTVTFTINNKSLVLTIGAVVTLDVIIENVLAMLSGTGSFTAGYSCNAYGDDIGEFAQLTAAEDTVDTVTLTGKSDGRPFILIVTEVTAGDGTATESTVTSPTGPHTFLNVGNWSDNTVPVDSDTIIFDERAVNSLLYGLDQNLITPAKIVLASGFANALRVGLPKVNRDTSEKPFDEYLYTDGYFKIGNEADAVTIVVDVDSQRCGAISLNTNTARTTLNVFNTPSRSSADTPAMLWKGTHVSNEVNVTKGDLGVAFYDGETAVVATLRMGYATNRFSDAQVFVGDGTTLGAVSKTGGVLTTEAGMTSCSQDYGDWHRGDGNITTATIRGGVMYGKDNGGTITNFFVYGGLADFSRDRRPRTITNATITKGSGWKDPSGTVILTNGLDFYACTPTDLSAWEVLPHQTWTATAI